MLGSLQSSGEIYKVETATAGAIKINGQEEGRAVNEFTQGQGFTILINKLCLKRNKLSAFFCYPKNIKLRVAHLVFFFNGGVFPLSILLR